MIVDFQHHFTPRELIKEDPGDRLILNYDASGAPSYTVHSLLYDLDEHVRMMDLAGIDAAWLTSAAGMCADLDTSRLVNDKAKAGRARLSRPLHRRRARASARRRRRVQGTGALPARARLSGRHHHLGIRRQMDRRSGDRAVLERSLQARPVRVRASGAETQSREQFDAYDTARGVGREFSLIMATIRLINSGVFDRHPELTVHMAHLSGGIAGMLARIRCFQDKDFWGTAGNARHGVDAEARLRPLHPQQSRVRHRRICRRHRRDQGRVVRNPGVAHRVRHRLSAGNPQARDRARLRADIRALGADGERILSGNVGLLLKEPPAAEIKKN